MESVSLQRRSIKRLVIDQPDAAEEDVSPAKRQAWWSPPMTRSRARKQELELQQTMVLQSSNIANAGPRVRKSASGSSVLERTLSGANAADVPTPPVSPSLLASHPLADHENDPEAGPSEREIAEARAAAARLGIGGTNQPALARKSPQQRKLPSGPEPQQYDIQYTPRSALQPLESPREAAAGVAAQLAALQWHTAFEALHTARRLVAHHRAEVQDRVPELLRLVLKSLRSPRSQLCKAAVMCAGDFFDAFEDEVAGEVDKGGVARPAESIVHQLLIKATSNDKKFVSEEAKAALAELARTLQAPNATKMFGAYCASHRNPRVRGQAAATLAEAAWNAQPARLLEAWPLGRALPIVAALLIDQAPEAREGGRRIARRLQQGVEGGGGDAEAGGVPGAWEQAVRSHLKPLEAQKVLAVAAGSPA